MVGSSILREVKGTDIINGVVKSIPGGTINDVKKYISEHKNKPKNIITQIGGNDLDNDGTTVESVTTQYELLLTETKNKFPESNVIISGLPPRFGNELIRTKVKDFNRNMKAWSEQNEITYIDNEPIFEFRNGDVDVDSYVMHGEMPALHLNRKGTIKLLENIKKSIPDLILSDKMSQQEKPRRTYASVLSDKKQVHRENYRPNFQKEDSESGWEYQNRRIRGCYNCGERNHGVDQCRYTQKLRCLSCNRMGHKRKFCRG